jgi:hypothetical protein
VNDDSNIDIIELLQKQIEDEKENYKLALKERKQFWQLKEIKNKIHDLEKTLEKIQEMNPQRKSIR